MFLRTVAVCCSVLQRVALCRRCYLWAGLFSLPVAACCSVLHCFALCRRALQVLLVGRCVSPTCCSVLQRVAACCSVLQCCRRYLWAAAPDRFDRSQNATNLSARSFSLEKVRFKKRLKSYSFPHRMNRNLRFTCFDRCRYIWYGVSDHQIAFDLKALVSCRHSDRKKPPTPGGFSMYYVP